MPTERTPLRQGENVPPYVFITNHNRSYKNKIRRFQCCICAGLLAIFITALVITVSYSVNHDDDDNNGTITVSMATPPSTTPIPVTDPALTTLLTLSWPLKDKEYEKWDSPPNDKEIESAVAEGKKMLLMKEAFEEKVPSLQLGSPSYKHQMSTKTLPKARELSRTGFLMEGATKALANKRFASGKKPMGRGPTMHTEFLPSEVCSPNAPNICSSSPYRTADGSCNNLIHPRSWGVAMRPFRRVLPPEYADGISAPRKAADGSSLPAAREVSLFVHRPEYRNDPNFTVMLAVWGQFIDHDITATALSQGKGGSSISCCLGYFQSGMKSHPECYTVPIKSPDPYYEENNITCMEFVRSSPAPVCSFGPREQMNQASSFLDGSVVYGTSDSVLNQLRTLQGGELKMMVAPDGRELLPVSTDASDGCNQEEQLKQGRYCFLSGDPRSNENIHLTSMHLLFARQHNMIARKLAAINTDWDDERLFQETRKIVAAQIQHITYNEFLPVILGPHLMEKLKMSPRLDEYSETYDSTLDPTISNSFAASAFRFGHTLLPGLVRMIAGDNSSDEYVEMHKMLFNPFQLYEKGFLEKAVRGAINTPVEKVDTYFNAEFTQRLFEAKRQPSIGRKSKSCGLDLVSLNVQRGRDHGLPGYPAFREHCGMDRPKTFEDLEPHMDGGSLERIKKMYKTVDDIDMYTGALSEVPVQGSLVGPTVTCLLTDQFLRLQRGDRYWYESSQQPQAFTPAQLKTIRKTTLAKIICDTSGVEQAQPMVMRGSAEGNQRTDCSNLPALDLGAWQESASVPVADRPGKIWLIKSIGPKAPTVVKFGGIVTGGSLTVEGTSVWSGALPIRIPVSPLDAVAQNTDSSSVPYPPVFGHGVQWSGSVMAAGGKARLDGRLSIPQYVQNPVGNVSVNWYNGALMLQIDLLWNSTGEESISLQGLYSSPLFFNKNKNFDYLQNVSVSELTPVASASTAPEQEVNKNIAPLVLIGTYTPDGLSFLWSGNVTLVIPLPKPEPPSDPNLLKLAYTPKSYVKHVKIGGQVISGTISAQGYNVWSGGLPLAIPVDPFDTIAGVEEEVEGPIIYGHGINWKGSLLSSASKTATLSGSFSLPRYVHSNGISPFSIHWYNGDVSIDLNIQWWSTCDGTLSIDGTYTTPVYFGERKQYEYLKDDTPASSLADLNIGFAGSPKQYEQGLKAPLVLLGTYSNDRKTFYWSGNFTLLLPQVVPIPDPTLSTTVVKETVTSETKVRVPLRLIGGQVNVGGWNVWYNTLPLGIPVKPFDSVASADDDTEPYNRPVVYGHGILWNGSVSNLDDTYIKIKGTFSFPQFVHSNGLTRNFTLSWLNGNFDLQLQTNKTLSFSGTFTTSVYFAERPTFELLRSGSINHVDVIRGLGIRSTDIPSVLFGDPEMYSSAPLILLGAYSLDRTEFLWSGDCILIAPHGNKAPLVPTLLKASADTATSLKLLGTVSQVNVSIDGVKVSDSGKPPLTIPTALFDAVSTTYSTANQPPVYAQGVLWSGKLTNNPSPAKSVTLTGSFSLPSVDNDTVSWYNGNFSLDIDVTWRSSNGTFADSFSSPIFLQEKIPKTPNTKLSASSSSFNSSLAPLVSPDVSGSAPIILTGQFSSDKATFLWSGEIKILFPITPKLQLAAEPPTTAVSRLSISAYANGGSITASGYTIWVGNRVPLAIPVRPFDSVVAPFTSLVDNSPAYGHGIPWKGYVTSDAPGTLKVWGSYSLPRYLHSNGTNDFKIDWYNGDFAFDLKLLWDATVNVNLQGTFMSAIYLQERSTYAGLTPEWSLSESDATSSLSPLISSNDTTSFVPIILLGTYSVDRTTFIWSGNVTFIISNQTIV